MKTLSPLKVSSLKDACIQRLEEMILSGELKIGQRLPAERDLAQQLGISRPVLHQAIVELDARGLVRIEPRRGTMVNDYRIDGSIALLESLLNFESGLLDEAFLNSLMEMRLLIESETARLAAVHRTTAELAELNTLHDAMKADLTAVEKLVELDFQFHRLIAIASGNQMYPLILNSYRKVYTHLTERFYHRAEQAVVREVIDFHTALIQAVTLQHGDQAVSVMRAMLEHGARHLQGVGNEYNN